LKLTTKREELVAKLSVVSRAVSTRAATQSLAGILLSANDEGVDLCATDLEMGLKTKLAAEVDGEGSVLLPGRLLAEVSRSLGDQTVEVELRESERDVEIRSGGSNFHLRTLPSEDFPAFPELESDPLSIPAAALAATVELVARAASVLRTARVVFREEELIQLLISPDLQAVRTHVLAYGMLPREEHMLLIHIPMNPIRQPITDLSRVLDDPGAAVLRQPVPERDQVRFELLGRGHLGPESIPAGGRASCLHFCRTTPPYTSSR